MSVPLLDLKAQHATIRDDVVAAVMGVVDSQLFILGEPVAELERAVATLSHTRHAIGCANGTDALLLALRALDVGRGDDPLQRGQVEVAGVEVDAGRLSVFRHTNVSAGFRRALGFA